MKFFRSKWKCSVYLDSRKGGRNENQDCCACEDTPYGMVLVVCDGMGGGPAGSSASTLAAQAIIQHFKLSSKGTDPEVVMKGSIDAANRLLRDTVKKRPRLLGMGTTCVVALVGEEEAIVAHVGDSRCYFIRNGNVLFRTADHSLVGDMVRNGELSEEDARRANQSNVITKALGLIDGVNPDIEKLQLEPGDTFALCTDGVWGIMPEQDFVEMIGAGDDFSHTLRIVMDKVDGIGRERCKGNYDNASLCLIALDSAKHYMRSQNKLKNQNRNLMIACYLLLACLCASIAANIYQFLNRPSDHHSISSTKIVVDSVADDSRSDKNQRMYKMNSHNRTSHRNTFKEDRNGLIQKIKDIEVMCGPNGDSVYKARQRRQREIKKDYDALLRNYNIEQSQKTARIREVLGSNAIIETRKDGGAPTTKAIKCIDEVLDSLEALK